MSETAIEMVELLLPTLFESGGPQGRLAAHALLEWLDASFPVEGPDEVYLSGLGAAE